MANDDSISIGLSPEITKMTYHHGKKLPTTKSNDTRYIVELKSKSMTTYQHSLYQNQLPIINAMRLHSSPKSPSEIQHQQQINLEQEQFKKTLSITIPSVKIQENFSNLFNGVVIIANKKQLKKIKEMDNVKAVYAEKFYHPNLDSSHLRINSQAIWNQLSGRSNAGRNIKVAVIDSGIRPENPMFDDNGFTAPASRPNDDYCARVDANFCNNKLIVARFSQPTFTLCNNEHVSPLGYDGHGTHVAGIAVGNQVSTTSNGVNLTLSGVAPGAYLMAYKALFTDSGCSDVVGSNVMLLEAMENAVNDGANVINNSWGGGEGEDPNFSPYKTAYEAAEAAGVVVVTAAGNHGNGPRANTLGCPACIEAGIAVANSTTGRFFGNALETANDRYLAIESSSTNISQNINGTLLSSSRINSANITGCQAFANNAFNGAIALIARGDCTFSQKATNADNAGAIAMIVYNNTDLIPFEMFIPGSTLPSLMISKVNGEAIIANSDNSSVTINAANSPIIVPELADLINDSSSRGPNGDPSFLKPDIAAPGTSILSAASPDTDGASFGFKTGTSMASPHVAGAAALIKQLHASWNAVDIKTVLTSSSKILQTQTGNNTSFTSPFDGGAGLLDLNAAANAVISFNQASFSSNVCVINCTFQGTVFNKSDQQSSWILSGTGEQLNMFVFPSTLTIPAGGSANFEVIVDVSQSPNDQWLFGNINFNSPSLQNAHLPVAVIAQGSVNSSLITTSVNQTDISSSDNFDINVSVTNNQFQNAVALRLQAPTGTQITSANNVTVTTSGSQQSALNVNTSAGTIDWSGTINLGSMNLTRSANALASIAGQAGVSPITCPDGCDDVSFLLTVDPFQYLGQTYNTVQMTDNGVLVIGSGSIAGIFDQSAIPDPRSPNNILAPFWSDFDLDDGSGDANETGGGNMLATSVTLNGDDWNVFEWSNVELFDDNSGNQYSFAIWIKKGIQEEIIFNYLTIPNLPSELTIGAESPDGIYGANYHFDGTGDTVDDNQKLSLSSTVAGNVSISYNLATIELNTGVEDSFTVTEDTEFVMDVLNNDRSDFKLARATITDTNGISLESFLSIPVTPSGAIELAIDAQPQHGTASITDNNQILYTPDQNFAGNDSFSYNITDSANIQSSSSLVNINVGNVNDVPVIAPISSITTSPGANVTVIANAFDADNTSFLYSWTQLQGTSVTNLTTSDNRLEFTAPDIATTIVFSVVASDGELNSQPQTATIIVTTPASSSKSGGAITLLQLLLLMALVAAKRMIVLSKK